MLALIASTAFADTLRIATYNTELYRKGPGLLFRDILGGKDDQITAVVAMIDQANADMITLQGIDYDIENLALKALAEATGYPHVFAGAPNAGRMTRVDLDGDGRTGEAADAQGYGRFFGQGAMAVMSRHPIETDDIRDFSTLLWRDLPDALLPEADGAPFPSDAALDIQRLSSHGHWAVPILHPDLGRVTLLTYHATPPVFDGPEDRNGKRNHDETRFWALYLDGAFGPFPAEQFVLAGDANLDPDRGDGLGRIMRALLADPRLQDPLPQTPTVTFSQTGPMRVDYVLPSSDWRVVDAQVMPADPTASRHSLVWVEITR